MQTGRDYTEADLTELARQAWQGSSLTQAQAAEQLGVKVPTFNQAVNAPARSLTALRIRIIEELAGFAVEGPVYRLAERKQAQGEGATAPHTPPAGPRRRDKG